VRLEQSLPSDNAAAALGGLMSLTYQSSPVAFMNYGRPSVGIREEGKRR
jgi:hypothetical protein